MISLPTMCPVKSIKAKIGSSDVIFLVELDGYIYTYMHLCWNVQRMLPNIICAIQFFYSGMDTQIWEDSIFATFDIIMCNHKLILFM